MSSRSLIVIAAVFGALGVALGAFGAHGLQPVLEANARADTFRTASHYHLVHALALLGAAWVRARWPASRPARWAGGLFIAGILLFSGSLYGLAIFNLGILGAVAPVGGAALIGGWLCLGAAAWGSADD